jgi:predicted nucleotidyltransferase
MVDTGRTPQWDLVRESIREPLRVLIQELETHLGDNLRGVVVVGSALTDDFRPGSSDINTVVLLDRHDVGTLDAVASLARLWRRHRLSAPLLMTPSYIERSRDVFGVEFLDFQLTHQTILGDDPFAAIRVEKADVRLQCERELKAMLVRLRQGYVAAAGDTGLVRDILISTAKGLAPLARAMLWLRDVDRPRNMEAALKKAAAEFHVDLDAAMAAQRWRHGKQRPTQADVQGACAAILDAVDRLTTIIDEIDL